MSPQNWVPQDWAEEQARRIAQEVKRLRRRGSHSAQWLADRTSELGYPVSRSTVTDLENGRRRFVTTAELMVLARALNTTPIALLYADPLGPEVEMMLPGVKATETFALQWFSGFVDIPSAAVADDSAEYRRNLQRLQTARQIWDLDEQKVALMKEGLDKTGKEKRDILRAIVDVQRQIDKLIASDGG
jgi:transcriptional regulator with XRE-family HTH domain